MRGRVCTAPLTEDDSLSVCIDIDGNDWDENWLNSLTEGVEIVDEKEDIDVPPPPPKIQTYKQAVEALKDVKILLEHHDCLELASKLFYNLSELATCHAVTLSQTTLHQFFH